MTLTFRQTELLSQVLSSAFQTARYEGQGLEFPCTIQKMIDAEIEQNNRFIAGWIKQPYGGDPKAAIQQLCDKNVELIALKVAVSKEEEGEL